MKIKMKMIKKVLSAAFVLVLIALMLGGCGRKSTASETTDPGTNIEPAERTETAEPSEAEIVIGREDGERFEDVIILEGMEETVSYEHVRNDTLGFEMDYDYESFGRSSRSDRECFISVWDNPENPDNYLEVTCSSADAETVASSVCVELSNDYDIIREAYTLNRVGDCIRIEASELKGTGRMADQLQVVYIIPAADGSRIATAHFTIESAEGFGRRFSYMMNTLTVIDRDGEYRISDEQAMAAVKRYCYSVNPDLKSIVNAGENTVYWDISSSTDTEIVVLFRSYTGAQVRYYIDRVSGNTHVTEFVPGITPAEEPSDESLNAWDYIF